MNLKQWEFHGEIGIPGNIPEPVLRSVQISISLGTRAMKPVVSRIKQTIYLYIEFYYCHKQ